MNEESQFSISFLFFFFTVCCTCLLEVERDIWQSTERKDPFCTASVCLPLQTKCMLGRLLSWRFLETWLDAPTSPQVSCYFTHCRCCSWKSAYSGWCVSLCERALFKLTMKVNVFICQCYSVCSFFPLSSVICFLILC